jgi:hypothetical protein
MARLKKAAGKSKKPPRGGEKPVSLARVQEVYEKYKPLLLSCRGVTAVTYGVKYTGGGYQFKAAGGRPLFAVIVHVKEKRALAEGDKGFIPKDLEGVPTDVVVATPRPVVIAHANGPVAQGGQEIELLFAAGSSGGRGTLGVVVKDAGSDQLYALTCAHVAFGRQLNASPNDRLVMNPGPVDLGNPDRNGFRAPYSQLFGPLDAGAVKLVLGLKPPRGQVAPHGKIPLAGVEQLTSANVEQFGAGTHATQAGMITHIDVSADVVLAPGFTKRLDRLIRVQPAAAPFGVPADSGSVLVGTVNTKRVAVGLYIGTDQANGDGFAVILENAVDALQLVY